MVPLAHSCCDDPDIRLTPGVTALRRHWANMREDSLLFLLLAPVAVIVRRSRRSLETSRNNSETLHQLEQLFQNGAGAYMGEPIEETAICRRSVWPSTRAALILRLRPAS